MIEVDLKPTETMQKYPYIGVLDIIIVLFVSPGRGIALRHPNPTYKVAISGDWGEERFVPYEGEIILKNG